MKINNGLSNGALPQHLPEKSAVFWGFPCQAVGKIRKKRQKGRKSALAFFLLRFRKIQIL